MGRISAPVTTATRAASSSAIWRVREWGFGFPTMTEMVDNVVPSEVAVPRQDRIREARERNVGLTPAAVIAD